MLDKGIDESEILALTFTNKAAKEMADRVRETTGKKLKGLTATTFHSFGLGLLKQYIQYLGYRNDFTLYDENDNVSLVRNCIVTCGFELGDYNTRSLREFFSSYKTGRMALPEKDFDDLILLPITIIEKKPDILEKVQDRYRYIMVDEFQDTSLLQYKLVSMIAMKYRNIAVVGDDDQSIYSWRGANYQNILNFEKDFPERKEYKLERNYRSTGNILNAANAVIVHNSERKEKKLWTESGEGASISIKCHPNGEMEALWIATTIRRLMREKKYGFKDFGVLVRTNSLMNILETNFVEARIPVRISGGSSFFDRKEVRDMLCFLKVLTNRSDDNSLLRIINTPRRGIGRTTVEKLRRYADDKLITLYQAMEELSSSPDFRASTQEAIKNFLRMVASWEKKLSSPATLINTIV